MTTRGVGLFLAILAGAGLALNAYHYWAVGRVEPMMLVPALGLMLLLLALPFVAGWRPFPSRAERLDACGACGTLWSPLLDGTAFCPACGGKTGAAR